MRLKPRSVQSSNWILSSLLSSLFSGNCQPDWLTRSDRLVRPEACDGLRRVLTFINRFQRVVALKPASNRPDRSPPTKSLRSPPYVALFGQIRLDLFRSRGFRLDLLNITTSGQSSSSLTPTETNCLPTRNRPVGPEAFIDGGGYGNFPPDLVGRLRVGHKSNPWTARKSPPTLLPFRLREGGK